MLEAVIVTWVTRAVMACLANASVTMVVNVVAKTQLLVMVAAKAVVALAMVVVVVLMGLVARSAIMYRLARVVLFSAR